jgi:2-polyprenyl-6-methoxyphenol hydroxylase-like FAD-dependent oxidoreductase
MSDHSFQSDYDVLVAGGGVAGIAAALSAARSGSRVALVEKTVTTGGLATIGNVLIYLPLSDSRGRQVTFGLAEELLHASLKYGPGDVPADWCDPNTSSRYRATFSPASFVLALDELLMEAGVEIWFDSLICAPVLSGDRVTGVEVENKSGRGLLTARCLIDATGDADIAFRAGAPCAEQDNSLSIWALGASLEAAGKAVAKGDGTPLLHKVILGGDNDGRGHPEEVRKYWGTDGKEVSEYALESRRLLRDHYRQKQAELGPDGRKQIFPLTLPTMNDFRTTRRIEGQGNLTDGQMYTHFDDCVGLVADWRGGRDVWEVPYGTLLPRKVKGLLAAGRCIAAAGQAWEVMRVIQAAVLTGEVCGLSAAEAVRLDTTPDALEVGDLQEQLKARGFLLDVGALDQ